MAVAGLSLAMLGFAFSGTAQALERPEQLAAYIGCRWSGGMTQLDCAQLVGYLPLED